MTQNQTNSYNFKEHNDKKVSKKSKLFINSPHFIDQLNQSLGQITQSNQRIVTK